MGKAFTGVYGGRYAVVLAKLHGEPGIDPQLAERGHRWEIPIADGVHALTGMFVHGEQTLISHPENQVWKATVDGLLSPDLMINSIDDAEAVLEVKTRAPRAASVWGYYKAQCQWQMHVTGQSRALIAVATIGVDDRGDETVSNLELEWLERDDYTIDRMVELADELWGHVGAGTLPDPDEHTDVDDVKRAHAESDATVSVDIDDLDSALKLWSHYKDEEKFYREAAKTYEAIIRHRIGEATEAHTSDGRWRVRIGTPVHKFTRNSAEQALAQHPNFAKTVLDVELFKLTHPALYDSLREPTTDRRLTVKEYDT